MYKLTKNNQSVIRKEDGACIPLALGNTDYSAYLEWVAEGGVPEPAQSGEEIFAEALSQQETALSTVKKDVREEGLLVDGVLFDTDTGARIAYIELMFKFMLNPAYTVADWKASDGAWVTMDKATFDKLIGAWEVKLTDIFTFVKAKEQEVKAQTTAEAILAVDVTYTPLP